jgi:predicted nucleotidyltransferase
MPTMTSPGSVTAATSSRPDEIAELCHRFGVVILYAFGSRADEVLAWVGGTRNAMSDSGSDVDVGVKLALGTALDITAKVHLALAIEDLLGVDRVDLVVLDEADPFLAANIIRGERLFAQDSDAADEYDLYVLRRAGDLAPFERERIRMILERAE